MAANQQTDAAATQVNRVSDRELVVIRTIDGPARLVFQAWTDPDLFIKWWAPKSFGVYVVSREVDVRTGGTYRLVMGHPSMPEPMAFFGTYVEVTPPHRIVWTNEEGVEGGQLTTVTFEETDGKTLITVHDLYPSKEALDETIASGAVGGWPEQFEQLNALVGELGAEV